MTASQDLKVNWKNVPTRTITAGGVDLDQDVFLPQLRVWHVASPHTVGASVTIENECLHRIAPGQLLSRTSARCRAAGLFECQRPSG